MMDYVFLGEVKGFDTDSYMPHLGWNSSTITRYKIYTMEGSPSFFLHDENENLMYEFIAAAPSGLNSKERYNQVVEIFETWQNGGQ